MQYYIGCAFGYQHLVDPLTDTLYVFVGQFNDAGDDYTLSTTASFTHTYDRVVSNFFPGQGHHTFCDWYGGPLFHDYYNLKCLEIAEEIRDPDCNVYRSFESCL